MKIKISRKYVETFLAKVESVENAKLPQETIDCIHYFHAILESNSPVIKTKLYGTETHIDIDNISYLKHMNSIMEDSSSVQSAQKRGNI